MIIAVDFDGTCVHHEFPAVGADAPYAVQVLKAFQRSGVKLILWTVRSDEHLLAAVDWFERKEIRLWGVNCNPEQKTWSKSPKAYAEVFIDDAALGCPLLPVNGKRPVVDWKKVAEHYRLDLEPEA